MGGVSALGGNSLVNWEEFQHPMEVGQNSGVLPNIRQNPGLFGRQEELRRWSRRSFFLLLLLFFFSLFPSVPLELRDISFFPNGFLTVEASAICEREISPARINAPPRVQELRDFSFFPFGYMAVEASAICEREISPARISAPPRVKKLTGFLLLPPAFWRLRLPLF
ncbi:hypothetical protein MA16_Dca006104 [Dendrobium catenatum]|uniref:Uncharacterized protein n=1 Tax=Dendrobium catenatum TaxID=906689 RepID=A0A2I0X4H0_9ASPA|nr:hypothetical protein MA16_Dca006104 [Dendrobium catenatum]